MTNSSIFAQFGHDLLEKKTLVFPLKDHPQISFILDTLSRVERHHLALITSYSEKISVALLETLAHDLTTTHVPKTLRNCYFIYFDLTHLEQNPLSEQQIENDFCALDEELRLKKKRVILSFSQSPFNSMLRASLKKRLADDAWRLLIFTQSTSKDVTDNFSIAQFVYPNTTEILALLKSHRAQLEDFHQVIISDEAIASAHTLAAHYLPGYSAFNKTIELLDSAAARASTISHDDNSAHKPVVSSHLLTQVIANWTQIPLAHLQHNKFQVQKFIETLQKNIFGQDGAINFIAHVLQNACINLPAHSGPLCSFLFVGPTDTGKKATAYAIAEHLFGHKHALLHVNLNQTQYNSLNEIKIYAHDTENYQPTLLSAVNNIPYAVILIEHVDEIPKNTLQLFDDILHQGYVFDAQGNKCDFRHTIIIMTTRFAADYLCQLTTSEPRPETSKPVDLMQLVLNQHVSENPTLYPTNLSAQEICDELLPKLTPCFAENFLRKVHAIPFMSLDYAAFEKIIRLKLKMLIQRLQNNFAIELSFAPEIIKFLAHEAFWRKPSTKSLDNLLNQHLFSCVAHEILLHAEDKNRSKRLQIQLNEDGQLLRCEFITSNETNLYNL